MQGQTLKNWMVAGGSDGKLRIRSGTDANVFTSSVTISHDGNVGIGTDSPGATFEVSGAGPTNTLIRSTGNLSSSIRFVNSANSDVYCGSTSGDFRVLTNGLERMRIDASGNVGIGTTDPVEALAVAGNGLFSGTVSAQGSILTSDIKFKTNIQPANSQLSDVTKLGNLLKTWEWKEDAPIEDKDTRFLGLIAQEVEEISPGIVAEMGEGDDAYKGIKHDVIVMEVAWCRCRA